MNKIWLFLLCSVIPLTSVYAQTTTTTATRTDYTVTRPVTFPMVEFEGRYWMPDLDGHAFVTDQNQSTNIDFKDDLGLDDNHGVPDGKLTLHLGPASKIRATYT